MSEDVGKYQKLINLRRERFLRMQTLTRPNYSPVTKSNPGDSQAVRVAVLAFILFALSGLIIGFAFGAFVHFSPAKTANSTTNITTIQQKTGNTPVVTKKVHVVPLGFPSLQSYTYSEVAGGTTVYSATLQATDKSKGNSWGNPVHASGITCKLWLVHHFAKGALNIPLSALQNIQSLQNPITGQVNGRAYPEVSALNFDGTSQTQTCNANGQATWKYTVSQSVKAGNYYLVALTDWNGQAFNWSWYDITIKQAN